MEIKKGSYYIIPEGNIHAGEILEALEDTNMRHISMKLLSQDIVVQIDAKYLEEYHGNPYTKTIKIKYFTDITPLESIKQGDLIDLRCAEDTYMRKGEYKEIPLGVAMELPCEYKANVYPRSSTFKKYHILLTNSVGQIDESYCGDNDQWFFCAYATENTFIPKDDRIAQFEIVKKQPQITFETVDRLDNEDRGGIGSTGRN